MVRKAGQDAGGVRLEETAVGDGASWRIVTLILISPFDGEAE